MILKYNIWVREEVFDRDIKRIVNQVYKLLPLREEQKDWIKPLETLIEELAGLQRLVDDQSQTFLMLMSKMEGLLTLTQADKFDIYRRTIFECLGLLNELRSNGKDS